LSGTSGTPKCPQRPFTQTVSVCEKGVQKHVRVLGALFGPDLGSFWVRQGGSNGVDLGSFGDLPDVTLCANSTTCFWTIQYHRSPFLSGQKMVPGVIWRIPTGSRKGPESHYVIWGHLGSNISPGMAHPFQWRIAPFGPIKGYPLLGPLAGSFWGRFGVGFGPQMAPKTGQFEGGHLVTHPKMG